MRIVRARKKIVFVTKKGILMNKRVIKKIVSVLACASMLAGMASISNATSINNGSSATIGTKNVSSGSHNFSYYVSYIHYDGLAVGAHMSGLRLRADMGNDSDYVCSVNSNQAGGSYTISHSGTHTYRLYNNTGKHVSITASFTY